MTTNRRSSAVADREEHPLAEAGQEAGQEVGHLAERAGEVGINQADRVRQQGAEGLNQLASSVRRVSSELESEQPMIANLTSTAAEQTERLAGFLRETDARQMVGAVEDFARRQPLLFVGGALALGVAASRFIKAAGGGSGGQGSQYGGGQYGRAQYGGTQYGGSQYGGTQYGGSAYGGSYEATGPGATGASTDTDRLSATDEGLRP